MRRDRAGDPPRVVVIGGGLGGIAATVKLRQAGIDRVTVLEEADGPGGTWWYNRYPGCEVDSSSRIYSFTFMPYPWTSSHASADELLQYCHDVIDAFGIRPCFRFRERVVRAEWDEPRRRYVVTTEKGDTYEAEFLVSAVGTLNIPYIPNWPGMGSFRGPMFHSARWEHEHDLTGRRVAVVGSGCTATQILPEVAKVAKHATLFQREPGWIRPKPVAEIPPEERQARLRRRWRERIERYKTFHAFVKSITTFKVGSKAQARIERECLEFIERTVHDPKVREHVTPKYPYGCKRPILSSTFYPALNRPNVELVPHAVAAVTPRGLVDATGVEREFDVVVLATGFKAASYLEGLEIIGRGGRSLHDIWAGDPRAYLGITVPQMPNFFVMYGPNTNGGAPITAQHERQAEFLTRAIVKCWKRGYRVVDTKEAALRRWIDWVDERNRTLRSATYDSCHNYYFAESGRNVTQFPMPHLWYYAMVRFGGCGLTYAR